MSEAAAPVKTVMVKAAAKLRKPAAYHAYAEMIAKAITAIGDKKGSSKPVIKKYILANFKVEDTKATNTLLNLALKRRQRSRQRSKVTPTPSRPKSRKKS